VERKVGKLLQKYGCIRAFQGVFFMKRPSGGCPDEQKTGRRKKAASGGSGFQDVPCGAGAGVERVRHQFFSL
jgi:hypothetical protein